MSARDEREVAIAVSCWHPVPNRFLRIFLWLGLEARPFDLSLFFVLDWREHVPY
jgi:hypothetical protein